MARKSRKIESPVILNTAIYIRTAMYIRLSVEDNKNRGNSIETQEQILENFIAKIPDLKPYDKYIDNGTTGTNFERPEFKRMIEDVENGNIQCIIVKDLSRLGRNSIDTGYYIEKYFPSKNVRFISVNDDFDTADNDGGIILPLKNMINEAYSIDISRKIRAQAQQDMKAGNYIGARPPYGYLKAPDNCHKLIINEETAPVVRQIFEWAADGIGINPIVVRLNESGILTPSQYMKAKVNIENKYRISKDGWQTLTVSRILADEVYVGDMVQGKTKSVNRRQVSVDKEKWIVVKDTHEPIISREIFDKVQILRSQATEKSINREIKPYSENIFKGKIFCKCCGKNLHRNRDSKVTKSDVYYFRCISNDRISKGFCEGVSLKESEVYTSVISILQKELEIILGNQILLQQNDAKIYNAQSDLKNQIAVLRSEIDKDGRFLRSLYENLVTGILTNEEYFSMKADYENKISSAIENIKDNESRISDFNTQLASYMSLADIIKKSDGDLNKELIDKMIQKITVDKSHNIDIQFGFKDEFADLIDLVSGVGLKASGGQEAL